MFIEKTWPVAVIRSVLSSDTMKPEPSSSACRCGFDSFAPDKRLDEEDARRAFATLENVYQRAADGRRTIADKRHEA